MKTLGELLKNIELLSVHGESHLDEVIQQIAYHSQKVQKDSLFVCIKGYKTDGHLYLKDAVRQGAKAAIVEEVVSDVEIPQYLVRDSRMVLALLSAAFYDFPSRSMKMIGVTATNGKTSTTCMINQILEGNKMKTGLIGTVVIKSDDEVIASELTTPESLDLQTHLASMKAKKVEAVTMEVSSSALELRRIGGIAYDIAVFNNISREHIDIHGSFENYCRLKSSLISNLGKGSFAVLNRDSEEIYYLKDHTLAEVISYSVESKMGDICCENLDLSTGRARFDVRVRSAKSFHGNIPEGLIFPIQMKVPGYHSVYNAMAAIAVALICDVPIDVIQQSLLEFRGVERRFELIFEGDFKIFDDHFANAGNIDVTLGTLEKMDYRKFILIYAIRGARGPIVNRENAQAIARWAKKLKFDTVFATKSRSHTTEKDWVTDQETEILREVLSQQEIKLIVFDEIRDACEKALEQIQKGDVILLAGCQGMDYGASIMLQSLHQKYPQLDENMLYAPLKHRICGVE